MRVRALVACIALLFAHGAAGAAGGVPPQAKPATRQLAAFSLAGVAYFHRFSEGDQHEYTPEGQNDLDAWTDMLTVQLYRDTRDGEALAATANAVLENYTAHGARVLKTASVPRSGAKEAEHQIVAVFARPEFVEVAFARFRIHGGVGTAAIRSHRVYGANAGSAMQAWLEKNGPATEMALGGWNAMPVPVPLK